METKHLTSTATLKAAGDDEGTLEAVLPAVALAVAGGAERDAVLDGETQMREPGKRLDVMGVNSMSRATVPARVVVALVNGDAPRLVFDAFALVTVALALSDAPTGQRAVAHRVARTQPCRADIESRATDCTGHVLTALFGGSGTRWRAMSGPGTQTIRPRAERLAARRAVRLDRGAGALSRLPAGLVTCEVTERFRVGNIRRGALKHLVAVGTRALGLGGILAGHLSRSSTALGGAVPGLLTQRPAFACPNYTIGRA